MPIYQYSRQYWYPNGMLASNIPARVFPLNSNVLATLYTDATGTAQASNPVTLSPAGVLSFYAEEGEYWVHIDSETFRVSVGSPDLDLPEVVSGSMSTGVVAGGELNVNGSNPAALDIGALTGYIVNQVDNPDNPVVTRVRTPAMTVPLDAPALLRSITWWLMTSAGTVIQQATRPTNQQRRTHLVLGATAQVGGALIAEQSLPVIQVQLGNQLADLMDALGPFSMDGNLLTPNANLTFNQSAGEVFSRAFNHYAAGVPTRNPHVSATAAQTPAQFRYITASGTVYGPLVSNVDVANYDVGGVITPVGGGAGNTTIHRVWLVAANAAQDQLAIQYGQSVYPSIAGAIDAIGQSGHVVNPLFRGNRALLAHIVVTRTATNLADPAQCRIINAGKFTAP